MSESIGKILCIGSANGEHTLLEPKRAFVAANPFKDSGNKKTLKKFNSKEKFSPLQRPNHFSRNNSASELHCDFPELADLFVAVIIIAKLEIGVLFVCASTLLRQPCCTLYGFDKYDEWTHFLQQQPLCMAGYWSLTTLINFKPARMAIINHIQPHRV